MASEILKQLMSAIVYLQANKIVHRNIRTDNILLSAKSLDALLKLVDFRFAVRCDGFL